MEIYSPEEIIRFVEQKLQNEEDLVRCKPYNQSGRPLLTFICLAEDVCYEAPWHGGTLFFKKGCYIHANPKDIYGLSSEVFHRCYQPIDCT
jgi:hypothetical protein